MGEIIFSFVIGGCLVLAGTILIIASKKEWKKVSQDKAKKQEETQISSSD